MPNPRPVIRKDLMTQSEAARRLGRSRPTVAAYAGKGLLTGEVVAGVLYLHRATVEELARELQPASAA